MIIDEAVSREEAVEHLRLMFAHYKGTIPSDTFEIYKAWIMKFNIKKSEVNPKGKVIQW